MVVAPKDPLETTGVPSVMAWDVSKHHDAHTYEGLQIKAVYTSPLQKYNGGTGTLEQSTASPGFAGALSSCLCRDRNFGSPGRT